MNQQAIDNPSAIDESNDIQALELVVENSLTGYYETGRALKEIRDRKLYPGNFREYVVDRFDMKYHEACRMVRAAEVAQNLKEAGLAIPRNEAQAHALNGLEPKQQVRAWNKALAEFLRPTAKQIEDLIRKMKLKTAKPQVAAPPDGEQLERATIPLSEVSGCEHCLPAKQPVLLASLDRVLKELEQIETEVVSVEGLEGIEVRLAEVERLLQAIRSKTKSKAAAG